MAVLSYELIFPEPDPGPASASGGRYDTRDLIRLFGWLTAVWAVSTDLAGCLRGRPSWLGAELLGIDAAQAELVRIRQQAERDLPLVPDPALACDLAVGGALWQRVQAAADRCSGALSRYQDLLQQPATAPPLQISGLRLTGPLVVTLSIMVTDAGSEHAVELALWAIKNADQSAEPAPVAGLGYRRPSAVHQLMVARRSGAQAVRGRAERRAELELDRLARNRPLAQAPIVLETTSLQQPS
jgi:hypothetical protein